MVRFKSNKTSDAINFMEEALVKQTSYCDIEVFDIDIFGRSSDPDYFCTPYYTVKDVPLVINCSHQYSRFRLSIHGRATFTVIHHDAIEIVDTKDGYNISVYKAFDTEIKLTAFDMKLLNCSDQILHIGELIEENIEDITYYGTTIEDYHFSLERDIEDDLVLYCDDVKCY